MGTKLLIFGVIVVLIGTVVGGGYHLLQNNIDDLKAQVKTQQEQIAGLEIDKKALEDIVDSKEQEIRNRQDEFNAAIAEIDELRNANQESNNRLAEAERRLNDLAKKQQGARVRNSRRADLLLHLMEKNLNCEIANFHNYYN